MGQYIILRLISLYRCQLIDISLFWSHFFHRLHIWSDCSTLVESTLGLGDLYNYSS